MEWHTFMVHVDLSACNAKRPLPAGCPISLKKNGWPREPLAVLPRRSILPFYVARPYAFQIWRALYFGPKSTPLFGGTIRLTARMKQSGSVALRMEG